MEYSFSTCFEKLIIIFMATKENKIIFDSRAPSMFMLTLEKTICMNMNYNYLTTICQNTSIYYKSILTL